MPLIIDGGSEIEVLIMDGTTLDTLEIDGTEVFSAFNETHTMTVGTDGTNYGFRIFNYGSITPSTVDNPPNEFAEIQRLHTREDLGSGWVELLVDTQFTNNDFRVETPDGSTHEFIPQGSNFAPGIYNYLVANSGNSIDLIIEFIL